ncbi:hypothetical protein [Noviherbaspirillum malthae]|uniref:hypothetical protein n=1 Tax=Noviherbaspirillum malthae TaxID=1260987 RepID=UPI00188F5B26|nr:hypothetical protein [Noviherbaspirillum malthae]
MPPRPLTQFEQNYANQVVANGTQNGCEYAAYLESPSGPLIICTTSNSTQMVDTPPSVHSAITARIPVVVHHNHLSQQSLSDDDWYGLSNGIAETFAHCADGTVYWGTVVVKAEVLKLCYDQKTQMDADNTWSKYAPQHMSNDPLWNWIFGFYGREVLNRAMQLQGLVKYGYSWGSKPITRHQAVSGSAGLTGQQLDHLINQAAAEFAKTL